MLDKELWERWKAGAKSTMNIPKIKKMWDKTKDIHTHEFVNLLNRYTQFEQNCLFDSRQIAAWTNIVRRHKLAYKPK
jgi:hypothetical protein